MNTTAALQAMLTGTRDLIFNSPDRVCLERARLATEGYQRYATEPAPLRRAKTFALILDQMSLDVDTNPILAGNTSCAPRRWMLLPEYGFRIPQQALIELPGLEGLLDGDAIPAEMRAYWRERAYGSDAGWGHLAVDYRLVLEHGLERLAQTAETFPGEPGTTEWIYRQAMAISLRAVIRWAQRYADAAQTAAQACPDPQRAAALARVAAACRKAPAQPASSLFEALQALTLIHLAIHIEGHGYSVSPGRLDQLLRPYYRQDADAVELIAAFMLKLSANSLWGSHSKTQPITIGGLDAEGHDASNPLTMCILEACELAGVPDPTLFLRWHADLAPAVKAKAAHMLAAGRSMPLLVGDEQTMDGFLRAGVSAQDALDYCIVGCNELGIPGKMIYDNCTLPEIRLLRDLLCAETSSITSMETLLDALQTRARDNLRAGLQHKLAANQRSVEMVPTPFTSALMDGGIQRGADLYQQMAYMPINILSMGFANLVNSLSGLAAVVFQQRKASLADIGQALRANFAGYEGLRRALRNAPRWGEDDPDADCWALAWMQRRQQVLDEVAVEVGRPLLMELVVRSLHHLQGRSLGATPDGRLAGEPLCDSVGPAGGVARSGPTALLNSVSQLRPAEFWQGGYNLNLTLPHAGWQQPGMHANLLSLIDVFFAGGGQELQVNALDVNTLREAQQNPHQHANLMVRIAGFNARFIDLCPLEQAEIIQRAVMASGSA